METNQQERMSPTQHTGESGLKSRLMCSSMPVIRTLVTTYIPAHGDDLSRKLTSSP